MILLRLLSWPYLRRHLLRWGLTLAGIAMGVGLFVAQNTVSFLSRLNPELRFSIPWDQLTLVVLLALGAALLMTVLPARQAARLTPAEALREA